MALFRRQQAIQPSQDDGYISVARDRAKLRAIPSATAPAPQSVATPTPNLRSIDCSFRLWNVENARGQLVVQEIDRGLAIQAVRERLALNEYSIVQLTPASDRSAVHSTVENGHEREEIRGEIIVRSARGVTAAVPFAIPYPLLNGNTLSIDGVHFTRDSWAPIATSVLRILAHHSHQKLVGIEEGLNGEQIAICGSRAGNSGSRGAYHIYWLNRAGDTPRELPQASGIR